MLRTLPPPDPRDVQRLHRTAEALGIDWPAELLYPDFIRSLDPRLPAHAAMVVGRARGCCAARATSPSTARCPSSPSTRRSPSEYAHVTAPLRRLVDRYAGEVCVALCAGTEVPEWVLERLPSAARRRCRRRRPARAPLRARGASTWSRRPCCTPHVGETFAGVVVTLDEKDPHRGDVVVREPAVEARVPVRLDLPLGADVEVTPGRGRPRAPAPCASSCEQGPDGALDWAGG